MPSLKTMPGKRLPEKLLERTHVFHAARDAYDAEPIAGHAPFLNAFAGIHNVPSITKPREPMTLTSRATPKRYGARPLHVPFVAT